MPPAFGETVDFYEAVKACKSPVTHRILFSRFSSLTAIDALSVHHGHMTTSSSEIRGSWILGASLPLRVCVGVPDPGQRVFLNGQGLVGVGGLVDSTRNEQQPRDLSLKICPAMRFVISHIQVMLCIAAVLLLHPDRSKYMLMPHKYP